MKKIFRKLCIIIFYVITYPVIFQARAINLIKPSEVRIFKISKLVFLKLMLVVKHIIQIKEKFPIYYPT